MIRFLYTLLLTLISPILLYSLYKKKEGKPAFGYRWKEHFGVTPQLKTSNQPIWIHAVSVGEAIAAIPIIKAFKKQNSEQPILVTTTTSTGAEQIKKLGELIEHRYMPIDFSFAVRGFLKATKPEKMLIMETELWPNTLHTVAKFGIPISVLNARLSEKSYTGYKKIQPIFNLLSNHLTHICCQTKDDESRFISLGIDKDRVHVTGSVKFDIEITDDVIESGTQLRHQLGTERPIWIAASTHKGEDEQVLTAHQELLKAIPNALLILVPRHPERFNSVFDLCKKSGFKTVKRTSNQLIGSDIQVYLGDTMGEMLMLIGSADICFMGGSLLGDKVGGHNILEPAALNVPVITGPSYYNFKDIVNTLRIEQGIIICESIQVSNNIAKLINDKTEYKLLQSAASNVVKKNQGALVRIMDVLNLSS